MEFKVGDSVYLKVPPQKITIRFGFFGKLKPRYIGPFDIVATYELALPPSLDKVHNICHISMLKKHIRDESHIILDYRELSIQPDVTYEEEPIKI